jgi:hypothetical protein
MQKAALAYPSTLKIVVVSTSKMLIDFKWTTQIYIAEDRTFCTTAVTTSNPTYFPHVPF